MAGQRVYVDSSVLINAVKATEEDIVQRAIEHLDTGDQFLFSQIVMLETIPKPTFNKYTAQMEFLQNFFDSAERVECTELVQGLALERACKDNLSACDALHVECAIAGGADALLTAEKPEKALPNASGIKVVSIW